MYEFDNNSIQLSLFANYFNSNNLFQLNYIYFFVISKKIKIKDKCKKCTIVRSFLYKLGTENTNTRILLYERIARSRRDVHLMSDSG